MSRILKAQNVKYDASKILIEIPAFREEVIIEPEENVAEFEEDVEVVDPLEEANEQAHNIRKEAKREAKQIVKEANEIADNLLQTAKDEIEKLKVEAQSEGYEKGHSEGIESVESIKFETQKTLDLATEHREQVISSVETEMVDIISKIVNKLTMSLVEIDPKVIMNLIYQGFSQSTLYGTIRVQVSAEDFENVLANKSEILAKAEGSNNVEILKNLTLAKSDCLIETPFGNIDCSLDQQLTALKNNLMFILDNKE